MLLLVVTLSALAVYCSATVFPMTIFADELCFHGVFMVEGDIIVMVSNSLTLPPNTTCSIQLQPNSGNSLVASLRSYRMDSGYTHSTDCPYESIQLGSRLTPNMLGPHGYCKSEKPRDQYILGEIGFFGYSSGPENHLTTPYVELLVTEVTVNKSFNGCSRGFFNCQRENICVSDELICNGYNDCGNNRDEEMECKLTPGVIAGIVIGGSIFIIIIVVLAMVHLRYRKMRLGYVQQL